MASPPARRRATRHGVRRPPLRAPFIHSPPFFPQDGPLTGGRAGGATGDGRRTTPAARSSGTSVRSSAGRDRVREPRPGARAAAGRSENRGPERPAPAQRPAVGGPQGLAPLPAVAGVGPASVAAWTDRPAGRAGRGGKPPGAGRPPAGRDGAPCPPPRRRSPRTVHHNRIRAGAPHSGGRRTGVAESFNGRGSGGDRRGRPARPPRWHGRRRGPSTAPRARSRQPRTALGRPPTGRRRRRRAGRRGRAGR